MAHDKIFNNNFESPDTEFTNINFELDSGVKDNKPEEDKIHFELIAREIHRLVEVSRFKKFNKVDELGKCAMLKKADINDIYGYVIDEMAANNSRIDIFSELCVYFDINPTKFYSSLSNVYKEDLIQELDLRTGILKRKNIMKLFKMIKSSTLNNGANRVWVLGDLHFGVRANSVEWLEIQMEFFEKVFIPTLKKYVKPGDVLVQVGDTFDNRQSINIRVLNYAVNLFERLGEILPVHIICGNHDIWAKGSNEVTSIDSLKWIPNIQIYKDPKLLDWSGRKILMMPWRRDSEHETETLAEYPTAEIVFCHSEVRGIYLNAKVKNEHGTDSNIYEKYTRVYSGHIHFRQERNKLLMVGTPYQLTRSDANNTKGFDLVDLEDMSETFFPNDVSPKFMKYNIMQLYDMPLGQFKNQIRNNFVDLFVPSQIATTNALSQLINKIQNISRKLEPNIYQEENYIDKDFYDMDDVEEMYKNYNILNLCNMYVDGLADEEEIKNKLKQKLKTLYDQCAYNNGGEI